MVEHTAKKIIFYTPAQTEKCYLHIAVFDAIKNWVVFLSYVLLMAFSFAMGTSIDKR